MIEQQRSLAIACSLGVIQTMQVIKLAYVRRANNAQRVLPR